jgi:aspartyl protease family protein
MREVVIFAGMVVALGVVAAKFADQTARAPAAPPPAVVPAAAAPPAVAPPAAALVAVPSAPARQNSFGSSVVIPPDARGHFVVDARVNGRHMKFILDTGASVVALRASDAAGLGMHPVARDFTVEVRTANGSTRAAPVQLNMVEISGLNLHNVAAIVSPDEQLGENLLGLSFLSRLRRYEFSNGKMVLEQ